MDGNPEEIDYDNLPPEKIINSTTGTLPDIERDLKMVEFYSALTLRQCDILLLLEDGLTIQEVSERTKHSVNTIKREIKRIRKKREEYL